jgi:dihydrofolate reductase/GNAT superfamily N-acetyltransferase
MEDGFRLRPATNADGEAIRAVVFGVLREFGLTPDPAGTDADLFDIESSYLKPGGSFDVLVDPTDQVVGTVGLVPLGAGRCELRKFYLSGGLRGRGLGKRLLRHAIESARARGVTRIELETLSLLTAAARLYESFGFRSCEPHHVSVRTDRAYVLDLATDGGSAMRTVTYGGACSLDMLITGPNGAIDWIIWSDEVQAIMAEYWSTIDTILMGRKTYEFAAKGGGGGGEMPGITSYVFSRTLKEAPGATIVSGDAGEFVRALKARPGKGIMLMGGGELARSLFEADVIDEVGVSIHPVLLGGGVPLVPGLNRRINLELVSAKPIAGGCVDALYRVKR